MEDAAAMTYTIDQIKAAIINCTASGDSSPVDPMTLAFIENVIEDLRRQDKLTVRLVGDIYEKGE